jgi:glycosyltransferase involved in cell wall biosynthesis
VLNTRNEAHNLPFALGSLVHWVDEIVVVDMMSDDGTPEIAASYGAVVIPYPYIGFADPARGFAVSRATHDWILILDADELVPLRLASRLRRMAESDEADVARIPKINYFFGSPLKFGGWGPSQNLHPLFFKRHSVALDDRIHAFLHPVPGSRVLDLPTGEGLEIHHFNYTSVTQFVEKLNRYTSIEAMQASPRRRQVRGGALLRGGREFLFRYLKQRGFRDGWRGFYLALLMAFYRVVEEAKIAEARHGLGEEAVGSAYDAARRALVGEHEAKQSTERTT